MKTVRVFDDRADVEVVLNSFQFDPIPRSGELASGATSELRGSMARFSSLDRHRQRRGAVSDEIAKLDPHMAYEIARARTDALLVGESIEVVSQVAFRVPTEVLCEILNLAGDVSELIADLLEVVQVIGRGRPLTNGCDLAVERLLAVSASQGRDPVSVISMLYQNHDATASLVVNTIVANQSQSERRTAVKHTLRIARNETMIGSTRIKSGEIIAVDLAAAGFEFGNGPHQCPGRELAESICRGIADAVASSSYKLGVDNAIFDDAGLPISLVLTSTRPTSIEGAS